MIALYLLGAVLVLLVMAALLAPLFVDREPEIELEDLPPGERREAALEALRELAFEHETGKLPDGEYEVHRSRLGKVVLEAGERSAAEAPPAEAAGPAGEARAAVEETGGECDACGRAVPPGASFCPGCGRRVDREGV